MIWQILTASHDKADASTKPLPLPLLDLYADIVFIHEGTEGSVEILIFSFSLPSFFEQISTFIQILWGNLHSFHYRKYQQIRCNYTIDSHMFVYLESNWSITSVSHCLRSFRIAFESEFHAFVAMDLASLEKVLASSGWRLEWLYKLQCNEVKHGGKVEIVQGMPSLHCFQALVGKRPVNCDEKNIIQSKQASYFSRLLGLPEHHGTVRYGMLWMAEDL